MRAFTFERFCRTHVGTRVAACTPAGRAGFDANLGQSGEHDTFGLDEIAAVQPGLAWPSLGAWQGRGSRLGNGAGKRGGLLLVSRKEGERTGGQGR